jgi:hypothetical protein
MRFNEEVSVMRNSIVSSPARLALVFAAAVLTAGLATPGYSQTGLTAQQKMADMKVKNPQSYGACLELAIKRGFSRDPENDTRDAHGIMMFVDGCIVGTQR